MKAIRVRYLGPTNYRCSRYKASDDCGNSVTVSFNYEDNQPGHVARLLANKMSWKGKLVGGQYDNDHYFVFIGEDEKVKGAY